MKKDYKDISDNMFLAAALEGHADFIITLDKGLLN
ncbi:MAG: putative toxin-antitoxin system toxin component, PIN family [bacterium]